MTPTEIVNRDIPYRGVCWFCGGPDLSGGLDARHRLIDAIRQRHLAGESMQFLSDDYMLPLRTIRTIVKASPQQVGWWSRRKR